MCALYSAEVKAFSITTRDGKTLQITFPAATTVLIQDNRQWTETFSIRIGSQGIKLAKGEHYAIPMTLTMAGGGGLATSTASTVVITAGPDWIPLKTELEIEPGSAVDLSKFGFVEGPCGKQGWVIANTDGHFAFENDANTPRRFYGVNFCFDALYISHDEADRLCDRLVRLGYNTIRVHHYESKLTEPARLRLEGRELGQTRLPAGRLPETRHLCHDGPVCLASCRWSSGWTAGQRVDE